MKAFLTGLGVGAVLGLLFAPQSGEDMRSELREHVEGLADRLNDTVEDLKGGSKGPSSQQG